MDSLERLIFVRRRGHRGILAAAVLAVMLLLAAFGARAFDPVNPSPSWYFVGGGFSGETGGPYGSVNLATEAVCRALGYGACTFDHSETWSGMACNTSLCPQNPTATPLRVYANVPGTGVIAMGTAVYQAAPCPTGYEANAGLCVPSVCTLNEGKEFQATVFLSSSVSGNALAGQHICFNNCRALVERSDCMGFTLADGTTMSPCDVVGRQLITACTSDDKLGTARTTNPYLQGSSTTNTAVVGGGPGTTGGGVSTVGHAYNQNDALNIARIASNTARIADQLGSGAGGGGGSGTAATGDPFNCAGTYTCTGDSANCAQLLFARRQYCDTKSDTAGTGGNAKDLYETLAGQTDAQQRAALSAGTQDFSKAFDRPRLLNETGCPEPTAVSLDFGVTSVGFEVGFDAFCSLANVISAFLLVGASLVSAKIFMGGLA